MGFRGGMSVYEYLLDVRKHRGAGFLVLIDPDSVERKRGVDCAIHARDAGVDAILVGASLMMGDGFSDYVAAVREAVDIPVVVFPGEQGQVTDRADALLFLSLMSGRNPEYLIGQQVKSAPVIRSLGIEAISTAYLLVESGRMTSVEFMSDTKPIPSDKPDIAVAHAIAAELFGMKFVYLEGGSGALRPVPEECVRAVSSAVRIPVIVGGGIKSPEAVVSHVNAGASFIVVSNHMEHPGNATELEMFVRAAHG